MPRHPTRPQSDFTITANQTIHRRTCRHSGPWSWPWDGTLITDDQLLEYLNPDRNERPCARCLPFALAEYNGNRAAALQADLARSLTAIVARLAPGSQPIAVPWVPLSELPYLVQTAQDLTAALAGLELPAPA